MLASRIRFAAAAALLACLAVPGLAAGNGGIAVTGAWSRATPPGAPVGAAYLRIENHGTGADRLLGVRTEVARKAEMHTTRNDGGIMKMRPLGPVAVPPGAPVEFAPGGGHVMLMGLTRPLAEGETYSLTLVFERAGEITVEVPVRGLGATGPGHGGHGHGGDAHGPGPRTRGSGATGRMDHGGKPMDHSGAGHRK